MLSRFLYHVFTAAESSFFPFRYRGQVTLLTNQSDYSNASERVYLASLGLRIHCIRVLRCTAHYPLTYVYLGGEIYMSYFTHTRTPQNHCSIPIFLSSREENERRFYSLVEAYTFGHTSCICFDVLALQSYAQEICIDSTRALEIASPELERNIVFSSSLSSERLNP